MSQQNKDYWIKRLEQLQNSLLKPAEQYRDELTNSYIQAIKELEKNITVWYKRFADNNGIIDMAEARRLLKSDELKELQWDIQQYIKAGKENGISADWNKELINAGAKMHISRLEALKLQTREIIEELYGGRSDKVDSLLKDIYKESYYKNAYELAVGTGIGQTFSTIDVRKLDNVVKKPWTVDGINFSDRIWQSKEKLINTIYNEFIKGFVTGENPKELTNKIAKTMNVSKSQAQRLVMTESAFFATKSQSDMYNNMGVEKYEILGTLDSTSCSECGSLDGRVFDTKDMAAGVTAPPFHPNCRCTTVPYFDDAESSSFTEGEKRIARDEDGSTVYVDGNMKYEEWKEKFVDSGSEVQQVGIFMEKSDDLGYNIRTKEEFEAAAEEVKAEISNYINNTSKWSGNINVKDSLINGNSVGVKEWSCDISVIESADDGVLWHEMLHSCSASYYAPDVYVAHEFIEEATVEFLKQQICELKDIKNKVAYEDKVIILKTINNAFGYGTDLKFAKEVFNIPLPERYQWLEDRVDESLRKGNASFEDYNEVMAFVKKLKGGRNGKN